MNQSKQITDQLLQSANNGDLKAVEELLKKGVNVNIEGAVQGYNVAISPLCIAASKGYVEIVNKLLQSPNIDVNQKDSCDQTALHIASEKGHLEVVEALLATKKADVNAPLAKNGHTPLHLASISGHAKVVQALIKDPNIQVNKKDQYGCTAMARSPSIDHEVVKVLKNVPGILIMERPNIFFVLDGSVGYLPDFALR